MTQKTVRFSIEPFLSIVCVILSCSLSACAGPGKERRAAVMPLNKAGILQKMTLANAYFMNKWPDPGKPIVTNRERPSNIWTRAAYYEGQMALYKIDPQKKYYDYAVAWGEAHQWGLWGGNTTRNADNQCCGQTYIDLYMLDPKPERIKNIKDCIDNVVSSPQNDDWWWIDAMQMAMPVYARLGLVYKDGRYFDKMHQMYLYSKHSHGDKGLYNPEDHLWWRDKDFDPPYKEPNGEDCYWSRGNGWVLAALARVLDILPANAAGYDEYLGDFKDMAAAIAAVQRPDGFWNVSLHDPNNFGGKETSGTAFFTYGIAWGINKGILDKEKYLPVVVKSWNAMVNDAVHTNGFLGYVQGTGKQPSEGQPVTYDHVPDFEDYGLGAFLLAGREMYKLAGE
jgi:unsaturated rhamnogalacturonyl hydrolase